jgi:SAM-dependent methyltransferase
MILTSLIKNIFRGADSASSAAPPATVSAPQPTRFAISGPSVLNVGGGSKDIPIPAHYSRWTQLLLDIAPRYGVDVVRDARELDSLDPEQFDAIYCSHNLEHYYRHDCAKVLAGFFHVLKPDGYAEIRVPDMSSVFRAIAARDLDIDDELYRTSNDLPITVHDVIYGFGLEIEQSGEDFFAHKRGFTANSLMIALRQAGFQSVIVGEHASIYEVRALAFKSEPTAQQKAVFAL